VLLARLRDEPDEARRVRRRGPRRGMRRHEAERSAKSKQPRDQGPDRPSHISPFAQRVDGLTH